MDTEITVPAQMNDTDALIWLTTFSDRAEHLTRSYLWKVYENESWKSHANSWKEFVEKCLNRSESWSSQQRSIYKHYILDAELDEKELEGVPIQNLYMARELPLPVKEQLSHAKTVSRGDMIARKKELKAGEHEHEWKTYHQCQVCGLRENIV